MDTKQATGIHIPTFVWNVVAVVVALLLYHFLFNGGR